MEGDSVNYILLRQNYALQDFYLTSSLLRLKLKDDLFDV